MSVNETAAQSVREETSNEFEIDSANQDLVVSRLGSHIRILAFLLLLSIVMTLGTLFWSARTQDEVAIETSLSLAQTALSLRKRSLESTVTDYTLWDEAFENTSENFSLAWFEENLGDYPYLTDTFDITSTFVVSPKNEILAYTLDSELQKGLPDASEAFEPTTGLTGLVEGARRLTDGEFSAASAPVEINGQYYLAAARVTHPHTEDLFAAANVTPQTGTVVVFLVPFDTVVASLRQDYGLSGAGQVSTLQETEALALPLDSIDGQSFGYLTWNIDRPSSFIFGTILPPVLALVLCIGVLGFHILQLIEKKQRRLFRALIEAKAADQAKIRFLSNVSHELRTPLNGVLGILQIMLRDDLKDEHRQLLSTVSNAANHLHSMINDLLDVVRINADRLELDLEPFEFSTVIEESVNLMRERARQKGIELHMSLPEERAGRVIGDPVRIKQVAVNLIDNAIKFTEAGRAEISVHSRRSGNYQHIDLRVKDTGIGIAIEDQKQIFSRFLQVDSAKSLTADGLGLGLPICKAVVDAMGGTIQVRSKPGEGTEFHLAFKLRREDGESKKAGIAA